MIKAVCLRSFPDQGLKSSMSLIIRLPFILSLLGGQEREKETEREGERDKLLRAQFPVQWASLNCTGRVYAYLI